jgi:hypothetical protein
LPSAFFIHPPTQRRFHSHNSIHNCRATASGFPAGNY